jgi:hypothetical protein
MPEWFTQALELLGVTKPLLFAAGTYLCFHWVNDNVSKKAKIAVSQWIQRRQPDKVAVANAIVEIFDRVYGRPLLSLRGFVRSSFVTIVTLFVLFSALHGLLDVIQFFSEIVTTANKAFLTLFIMVCTNIISDYLSLFVVRALLVARR